MKIFNEKNLKLLDERCNNKLEKLLKEYKDTSFHNIEKYDKVVKGRFIEFSLKLASILIEMAYKIDKLEIRE